MSTLDESLECLGLVPAVLKEEPPNIFKSKVKKAWRLKALKEHPDKGGDEEKFKKCKAAYENLERFWEEPEPEPEPESEHEHHDPDAASRKIKGRWTRIHNSRLRGRVVSTLGTTRTEQDKRRERGPTTYYVVNDRDGGIGVYSFHDINRRPLMLRPSKVFFENGTVVVAVWENKDFIKIGDTCYLSKRDLTTLDGTRVVPLPRSVSKSRRSTRVSPSARTVAKSRKRPTMVVPPSDRSVSKRSTRAVATSPARSVSKGSETRTTSVLDQSVAAEAAESAEAARAAQQMDPRSSQATTTAVPRDRGFSFSPCLDRMWDCFDRANLKNKGYTKKKRKSKKRKTKKKKHTSKKHKSKKYTKKRK
jgi:hypothetical protein